MLRELWTKFNLLANYRKFLILAGLLIVGDILHETATGGMPKNSDETGTAVIYLIAGILAIYAGVKKNKE